MKKYFIVFFICFISIYSLQSQSKDVQYAITTSTGLSSDTTLPFWLVANQYGSVPDNDYGLLNTSVFKTYNAPDKNFDISYEASATGFMAQKNKLLINELYFGVRFKNILLDLGAKNDAVAWQNLSSSNGSIIKSINARAMPGINIKTNDFITLPFASSWLSVKANFAHYFMDDTRFVDNTNLHHKSLNFKSKLSPKFAIIAGLDHYVQWGGTSPVYGPQPSSFKDYIKVIFGAEGADNATLNDQFNALGNHIGAYLLQFNYEGQQARYNFYYSHPFEDTSGRELTNWQDGLYGFFIDFRKEKATVTHLLAEFTYTKTMSNIPRSASGPDNYFNNGIYKSGWTYQGNTIGSPYFTPKPVDDNGITRGIIVGDNRFSAINLGVSGFLKRLPYRLLVSHTTYYGFFDQEYDPNPYQFSGLLDCSLPEDISKLPFTIAASLAFDGGYYRPKNFGAFISISKTGIF